MAKLKLLTHWNGHEAGEVVEVEEGPELDWLLERAKATKASAAETKAIKAPPEDKAVAGPAETKAPARHK